MSPSTLRRPLPSGAVARWALLLLLSAVLGGCGDDDPVVPESTLAITTNADVAALLGTPFSDADLLAEFQTAQARSEELIVACMANAGFEYIALPFPPDAGQPVQITDTSLGVADQYFGAYVDGFEAPAPDPNSDILEALSDDDRSAYSAALQGGSAVFDARFETSESIREGLATGSVGQAGCRFESQQVALAETDRNQALIDDYITLRTGLFQTDQRLFRARVEWARCMAEAGFTYRDEGVMRDDLNGQAVAVLQDLVALRDEGVELVPGQAPPPQAAERIDELRDREAQVASAHAVCREPVDTAIDEVRAEVDEIFLERNE